MAHTIEKPVHKLTYLATCTHCYGKGTVEGQKGIINCYVCEGRGVVRIRKEIKITIETI
jgi:DnaJ-class molecular chaperone